MKNKTTDTEKKKKKAAKRKTKSIPSKQLDTREKNKVKSISRKKAKESIAAKTKSVAKNNVRKTTAGKPKRSAGQMTKKPFKAKTKGAVKTPLVEEKITHGEDLHLIPVEGEIHPIDTPEAHRIENLFQKREEVSLQQENRKVKDALGSRKNLTKNFRRTRYR